LGEVVVNWRELKESVLGLGGVHLEGMCSLRFAWN
jgi:hypothetical protein